MQKFKTVFSLRIKKALKEKGFEPDWESDNLVKPGFKCWVYEATPEFMEAFDQVASAKGRVLK